MTTSMQSEWIKEAYNGGGWENSIKISSFDELRENILDLGASISFNDDFQGISNAAAHLDGRIIFSETDIDSYRSYLTSRKVSSNSYDIHGHYDDFHQEYNGSPVTFSFLTTNSLFSNLPYQTPDTLSGEKTYLAS